MFTYPAPVTQRTAVIVQSNYIPWKGFFDLIRLADVFVFYDDMQYTRRDWRNRNQIKTPQGLHWLTIPVKVKGKYEQRIDETEVSDHHWAEAHWKTISNNYRRAAHFDAVSPRLQQLYEVAGQYSHLSSVNELFTRHICEWLGIKTLLVKSSDYGRIEGRTENLVHLCRALGATDYISGPAAADYIQIQQFSDANIRLHYMNYAGYPPYPQLYGEFVHGVSIIDTLVHCGAQAGEYLQRNTPTTVPA